MGYLCEVVQQRIPHSFKTRDLYGFADIEATGGRYQGQGNYDAWLLQATDDTHHANRRRKIVEDCAEAARAVLRGGVRIAVVSWGKRGGRGERKRWAVRIEEITLADVR